MFYVMRGWWPIGLPPAFFFRLNQDLQDSRIFRMKRGEGQVFPSPYDARFNHRSAGACPPRSLDLCSMARDRPSPYGVRHPFFTVARGPVPRDRSVDRSMARDRPSPYGKGGAFCEEDDPPTVARGPVPRERWDARTMARDRVSHHPTVIET